MSAEQSTVRLRRLAALAAEADDAVREAVGDRPESLNNSEPLPVMHERCPVEEIASTAESAIDNSSPDDPMVGDDAETSDAVDDDLIAMASGLDIGLEPDPPRAPVISETTPESRSDRKPTLRSSDRPSAFSLRNVFAAALIVVLGVGTFSILRPGTATDAPAILAGDPTEISGTSASSELTAPVRTALVFDDAVVDVDLQATVGELSNGAVTSTAWELVGSEPGTAMFADLVDPAWLRATFERTTAENGEPATFTFFSPADTAIAGLDAEQVDGLVSDPERAQEFINAHIVDVQLTEAELRSRAGTTLTSRSGASITVTLDGEDVLLNGQTVIFPSLVASNGTVMIIDDVLHSADS